MKKLLNKLFYKLGYIPIAQPSKIIENTYPVIRLTQIYIPPTVIPQDYCWPSGPDPATKNAIELEKQIYKLLIDQAAKYVVHNRIKGLDGTTKHELILYLVDRISQYEVLQS